MQKLRLAVAGCGFLGNIIVDAWKQGLLDEYEIVGVMGRTPEKAEAMAEKAGCPVCKNQQELLDTKPDYIAEAASVPCMKELAIPALEQGVSLAVLSIGAFADPEFYEKVQQAARKSGARVHIASGAIGGFDVLRTITLMGEASKQPVKAGIESKTCPQAFQKTSLFRPELLETSEPAQIFGGNAKEAIAILPARVNVAVATSLATAGPDTDVNLYGLVGMVGDDHKITAEIPGVKTVVDTYSDTSAIAGWSVVALLRNLVSPIMF